MSGMQWWELLSYVVTVIGLPLAIFTFWQEKRKERENEDEETYQLLSDAYTDFLKLVLDNPDLQLRSRAAAPQLSEEQQERRQVVFEMLVSLFERAYLLAYDDDMTEKQRRRWHVVGRLHARMVPASRFLRHAPATARRRGRRFRRLHPQGRRPREHLRARRKRRTKKNRGAEAPRFPIVDCRGRRRQPAVVCPRTCSAARSASGARCRGRPCG